MTINGRRLHRSFRFPSRRAPDHADYRWFKRHHCISVFSLRSRDSNPMRSLSSTSIRKTKELKPRGRPTHSEPTQPRSCHMYKENALEGLVFTSLAVRARSELSSLGVKAVRRTSSPPLIEDEDCGGDDRGPQAAFIPDRGLRHICGANNFVRDAIDFFLLVPGTVGIELHVQRRREHLGRQLFSVVAGSL